MDRLLRIASRGHLLAAILPAGFLALFLFNAVRGGFMPVPELYPPPSVDADKAFLILTVLYPEEDGGFGGRTIAILGMAQEAGSDSAAGSVGVELARLLAARGARVSVSDPRALQSARRELGEAVTYFENPYRACRGTGLAVVVTGEPEYAELDFKRLAGVMGRPLMVDASLAIDSLEAEAGGLRFMPGAKPKYPFWLDPEFQEYAAGFEVPAEALPRAQRQNGLLMVPTQFMGNHPRGRWYLALNYYLFPRRLYLIRSELASGTMGQFQEWVRSCVSSPPVVRAELLRWADELKAAWLLRYRQDIDFRKEDYTLERLR